MYIPVATQKKEKWTVFSTKVLGQFCHSRMALMESECVILVAFSQICLVGSRLYRPNQYLSAYFRFRCNIMCRPIICRLIWPHFNRYMPPKLHWLSLVFWGFDLYGFCSVSILSLNAYIRLIYTSFLDWPPIGQHWTGWNVTTWLI